MKAVSGAIDFKMKTGRLSKKKKQLLMLKEAQTF
jgi:hypothetical protein